MRIALLSDIHGNSIALDAVLDDLGSLGGVDGFWVLGDLVALGPDPVGVLERLAALEHVRIVHGNTDRYTVTGERPSPGVEEAARDPALLPVLTEVAASFAWTQGVLTGAGWLEWLGDLPLELRADLPDGTSFLGVHAAPGNDDGPGVEPSSTDEELRLLMGETEPGLICVGHTHLPVDRVVDPWHIVNLGSVRNPRAPDLRASYVVLDAGSTAYAVEHRRVPFDRQKVISMTKELRHPGGEHIVRHMLGLIR